MAADIRLSADLSTGRIDCESPGHVEVTGSLIRVDRESFDLDLCQPTEDCSSIIRATFAAKAPDWPGFNRYLRRPAFIRVALVIAKGADGCTQRMSAVHIASWRGAPDPARGGNRPYFAIADNDSESVADWLDFHPCIRGQNTCGLQFGKAKATLHLGVMSEFTGEDRGKWSGKLLKTGLCGTPKGWSFWLGRVLDH